jgi:hypothetical protein
MPKIRPFFEFKVWIEEQSNSGILSAHCLETGAVATANDFDTVVDLIEEVLESEASLALDSNDFANLYSSPAPPEILFKWNEMSAEQEPEIKTFEIRSRKYGPKDQNIPKKPVVSSQIEVAFSDRQHA